MTAIDQLGWTDEKNTDCNREAGDCPVCGQAYEVTRTVPNADGREGAFYAHDTESGLVKLCIEWVSGETTRGGYGRREDWMGRR